MKILKGDDVKCVVCGKGFYRYPYLAKKGLGRFCSTACYKSTRNLGDNKKCEYCGKEFYVNKCFTLKGLGKFCSSLCYGLYKKQTQTGFKPGKLHPNWKGGVTKFINKRLNTPEWKRKIKEVGDRDSWTCQKCKNKYDRNFLQCDHIIPWRISHDDSLDNLQTLCKRCHTIKDINFRINEDKACAFIIVSDSHFYPEGAHIAINSFRRFHSDVDLIVFRQDKIDEVFSKTGCNWFTAKPFFGELVSNMGYKVVCNVDADHIFTGRLTEVFDNVDYDVAMPTNLNDYENASFDNITEEMYLQAGMVASTNREFWKRWQKINDKAMSYLRKENDTVNLLIYNEMSELKLKILDKEKDYYGCKSLGREPKFYIEDDKLMCMGEQVRAYHFARGNVFPKLNFPEMPFTDEVKRWLMDKAYYGQTIKIK